MIIINLFLIRNLSEIADIFIVSQVERVSEEANNSEIKGISIL